MAEHVQNIDGIDLRVQDLEKTVFGDRANPTERPGLIVEQVRMGLEQKRTNEILTEFRDDVRKAIGWLAALMVTGFATAVFTVIFKK